MKKLLVFGPMDTAGGVGHIMMDLFSHMDLTGLQVDFFNYVDVCSADRQAIESLGAKFYVCPRYSRHPVKFLKWIFNHYKTNQYDIVHCNVSTAMAVMYTLPAWFNKKIKVYFHSHAAEASPKWFHYLMRVLVQWRADERIAISEQAAIWMFGKSVVASRRYHLLKNGIDAEQFAYDVERRTKIRKQLGVAENVAVIGNVGRLVEVKNHAFFLDVMQELNSTTPNIHLLLVGDGTLKEALRRWLVEKKLAEKTTLIEYTNTVNDYLFAMDAFLFPSKNEGLGIAAVEAQAADLPVLASEAVPPEAAVLDTYQTMSLQSGKKAWANKLAGMLEHKHNRVNRTAEMQRAGYDINVSAKQLRSLYFNEP